MIVLPSREYFIFHRVGILELLKNGVIGGLLLAVSEPTQTTE